MKGQTRREAVLTRGTDFEGATELNGTISPLAHRRLDGRGRRCCGQPPTQPRSRKPKWNLGWRRTCHLLLEDVLVLQQAGEKA